MTISAIHRFLQICAFAVGVMVSGIAFASDMDATKDFANAKALSDSDLADMRGGFIDPNDVLISFSLVQRAVVGNDVLYTTVITSEDLALAGSPAPVNVSDIVPANIIMNSVDNNKISVTTSFDAVIQGSAAAQAALALTTQNNITSVGAVK